MNRISPVLCAVIRGAAVSSMLLSGACATETTVPMPAGADAWDKPGLADRPPTARTLYEMSRMLAARGKDSEAGYTLASCIERYPEFLPAYVEAADLNLRYRKFDAAVAVIERGLEVDPNDPVLRNNLGMCWFVQNEHERALAEFLRASQAAPDDARFTANAALAAGMLGQYDRSLELYERIVTSEEAHLNLAIICEARHDQARADHEYGLAKMEQRR